MLFSNGLGKCRQFNYIKCWGQWEIWKGEIWVLAMLSSWFCTQGFCQTRTRLATIACSYPFKSLCKMNSSQQIRQRWNLYICLRVLLTWGFFSWFMTPAKLPCWIIYSLFRCSVLGNQISKAYESTPVKPHTGALETRSASNSPRVKKSRCYCDRSVHLIYGLICGHGGWGATSCFNWIVPVTASSQVKIPTKQK